MRTLPTQDSINDFVANPAYEYFLGTLRDLENETLRALEAADTDREIYRTQGRLTAYRRAIMELTSLLNVRRNHDAARRRQEDHDERE